MLLYIYKNVFSHTICKLDNSGEMSVGGGGVPENRWESPNTRTLRFNVQFAKDKETKNLQKTALASKVMNSFTRARAPPFTGRRRDFLHSETTLESREYS
jgi:hypothetical protein